MLLQLDGRNPEPIGHLPPLPVLSKSAPRLPRANLSHKNTTKLLAWHDSSRPLPTSSFIECPERSPASTVVVKERR